MIDRERLKNECSEKDMRSYLFVNSCRHYNQGLAHKTYILKVIDKYMHNFSLSTYVKKIPDMFNLEDNNTYKGISAKAESFFQRATICALQRVTKKYFIEHLKAHHPDVH